MPNPTPLPFKWRLKPAPLPPTPLPFKWRLKPAPLPPHTSDSKYSIHLWYRMNILHNSMDGYREGHPGMMVDKSMERIVLPEGYELQLVYVGHPTPESEAKLSSVEQTTTKPTSGPSSVQPRQCKYGMDVVKAKDIKPGKRKPSQKKRCIDLRSILNIEEA